MKMTAKMVLVACLLAVLSALLSGCIVWEEPWWQQYPPRAATFYVYVYDYYTGTPIPWAGVELYEEDWWSWDYVGTWPMSPYGYAVVTDGYLTYNGDGYAEEAYRLRAFAQGYYTESCEVSVSYYDPMRTIYFYLAPWPLAKEHPGERAPELAPGEGPPDRVKVVKTTEERA
jgi:hypothetical protein